MIVGLLGNKSPDSNRFTLVTPKPENGVRLQATLGNQNPTGLPVGVVRIIFLIYSYKYYAYPLCFLPLLGNLIFIVSDLYLAKTLFIKHDKREDFYIMFTYLVGQFLLSLSIGLFY